MFPFSFLLHITSCLFIDNKNIISHQQNPVRRFSTCDCEKMVSQLRIESLRLTSFKGILLRYVDSLFVDFFDSHYFSPFSFSSRKRVIRHYMHLTTPTSSRAITSCIISTRQRSWKYVDGARSSGSTLELLATALASRYLAG